jgi:general secretion pathway protein E/type IV pilus assembly protein PilB
MNKPDRKLVTVEDPVEYQMNGINQVPVNASIGMTFPAALRSILRQAPNIIMIGEIRDNETASIAVNASLTGHLVLSTLHTNDAPSAIARLVDIGVKPFLVSSSVRARGCPEACSPLVRKLQGPRRVE